MSVELDGREELENFWKHCYDGNAADAIHAKFISGRLTINEWE